MTTRETSVTASPWPRAGASIAVIRGADVLLIQRGKPPMAGIWSLPGGRIEPGEAAAAAALRELAEETSVEAEITGLIGVHDAIARTDDGRLVAHYLLAVYAARWLAGEPRAGDDALAAEFVPVDRLAGRTMTARAAEFVARAVDLCRPP